MRKGFPMPQTVAPYQYSVMVMRGCHVWGVKIVPGKQRSEFPVFRQLKHQHWKDADFLRMLDANFERVIELLGVKWLALLQYFALRFLDPFTNQGEYFFKEGFCINAGVHGLISLAKPCFGLLCGSFVDRVGISAKRQANALGNLCANGSYKGHTQPLYKSAAYNHGSMSSNRVQVAIIAQINGHMTNSAVALVTKENNIATPQRAFFERDFAKCGFRVWLRT